MAAAVYATDLADILLDMAATTGWTALGGGASGLVAPETDFYIQGNNCISKAGWSTAIKGMIYSAGAQSIASGEAVFMWVYFWAPNSLDTEAGGGLQVLVGSGSAAYKGFNVGGNDTLTYGGWLCAVVDPTLTADTTVGSPTATTSFFGATADVPSAGPSKGQPLGIDAIRHGRELQITLGDLANGYATFDAAAAFDNASTRRWGLLIKRDGAYYQQGLFLMGAAGTVVDFRDSNRVIFVQNTKKVAAAFNGFEVRNASSRVDWTNISISALGTVSRGTFTVTDNADVNIESCTFTDMGTFAFLSNSTVNNTVFRRCGMVTTGGGVFTGCTFDKSRESPAVLVSSPANAELISDSSFISTGSAGHAIQVNGTAANFTLTNVNFSGYASANGSTGSEAVFINIATGSLTLTISGGTIPSVRTAGATVNVVSGAVTATLTVTTATGTAIADATVLVTAANATGDLPYQETVTITNSGTTATVTHTAHGMATNDKVLIKGASHYQNRGVFSITVTNANTYTYTMASAPGSNPTGTITATWVALSGTTNVSGQISMSRVFSVDQPVAGWARKSSSAPYYKTGPVNGVIDSGTGASLSALLIADE